MILFDINYRICLDFPYPYGLDDCWQAYHWILNYCEVILRMKPQKIILVGESMGGNLALVILLNNSRFDDSFDPAQTADSGQNSTILSGDGAGFGQVHL